MCPTLYTFCLILRERSTLKPLLQIRFITLQEQKGDCTEDEIQRVYDYLGHIGTREYSNTSLCSEKYIPGYCKYNYRKPTPTFWLI